MLSHVLGSGGPDEDAVARALISGPMSTTTSFWRRSGRLEAKYIALRPPDRESDEDARGQAKLIDGARDVVEGRGGSMSIGRVAVAVAARVESVDVKVGLQRDAERVPRVRMPREAVEEQEGRATVAAPVQDVKAQPLGLHVQVARPQEVHGVRPPGYQKRPDDGGGAQGIRPHGPPGHGSPCSCASVAERR